MLTRYFFKVIIKIVLTTYVFNESAFKHGISEDDIRRVFERSLFDGLIEGYDNKFLITGFSAKGNIIGIMYNLADEYTVHIFHAMRCRKIYRVLRNQN